MKVSVSGVLYSVVYLKNNTGPLKSGETLCRQLLLPFATCPRFVCWHRDCTRLLYRYAARKNRFEMSLEPEHTTGCVVPR